MIDDDQVVHDVVLVAAPDEVFEMFVDAAKLIRWIGIAADIDPQPGGRFRFEVMPGQYCEGRYEVVDRPRYLVFTWGWSDPGMAVPPGSSTVEVSLAAEGTATRLRLVHRDLPGDAQARRLHDDGWSRFLARLTAVIADDVVAEYPTERPHDRLEQLRELELTERDGGTHKWPGRGEAAKAVQPS